VAAEYYNKVTKIRFKLTETAIKSNSKYKTLSCWKSRLQKESD